MDFNFKQALETLNESQYIEDAAKKVEDTAKKVLESTISELKKNHVFLSNISRISFYIRQKNDGEVVLKSCYSSKDNHVILRELCSINNGFSWELNLAVIEKLEAELKEEGFKCINFKDMEDIYEITNSRDMRAPEGFDVRL